MFGRIKFLLLYFFSWVLFFEIARVVFLIYHAAQTKELTVTTILGTLEHGLRMDLSLAGYLLIPVCLFTLAGVFVPFFRRTAIYRFYTFILLFFSWFIILVDLELFSAWGFRIDATPLIYLRSPKEVWASISHLPLFLIAVIFLVSYVGFCFLFSWIIRRAIQLQQAQRYKLLDCVSIILVIGLLIIPIRGGLQLAPLNQSSVYFSTNNFANQAAINAAFRSRP